jgi:thiamine-phosphate pyrophosphorylase
LPDPAALFLAAEELVAAGATLLQYRNKSGNARQTLEEAQELRRRLGSFVKLIMNDRADLCLAAGFDGVHVGQEDLSPEGARKVIGEGLWLGVSTHNPEQISEADKTSADYLAVGPVFSTTSKARPDPVIGLEGVRRARSRTRKPLVAIGGITRANCRSVIEAGADSVAVISDLVHEPRKSAEDFLRILR